MCRRKATSSGAKEPVRRLASVKVISRPSDHPTGGFSLLRHHFVGLAECVEQ